MWFKCFLKLLQEHFVTVQKLLKTLATFLFEYPSTSLFCIILSSLCFGFKWDQRSWLFCNRTPHIFHENVGQWSLPHVWLIICCCSLVFMSVSFILKALCSTSRCLPCGDMGMKRGTFYIVVSPDRWVSICYVSPLREWRVTTVPILATQH